MPTPVLMPSPRQRFFDNIGLPLVRGYVFTFAAGTSTKLAAYQDAAGLIPHENPIRLDDRGEATIYWLGNYKVDLRTAGPFSTQVPGYPVDNFNAIDVNDLVSTGKDSVLATFLTSLGSSLIGFLQGGVGAILRTLQDKNRDVINVADFGARPGIGTDQGPKILAAHTYATSINAELEFSGGVYTIGASTSFVIDPLKTRWTAKGPVGLRWSAAPSAGFYVRVASSETAPYETSRNMNGPIIDGVQILGSMDPTALFAGTGLDLGDGTKQTFGFEFKNMTIQGMANIINYNNNVWWARFSTCRLMWGSITTPSTFGNWGEANTFHDCILADGVTMTINYGQWQFYGRSLDNSQIILKNISMMSWSGAHIENPGQNTFTKPFIDIQGSEATCHLISPQLVINNNGSAITTAPFNVVASNKVNGFVFDGLQYTQGSHAQWYSIVSGGGYVRARSLQPLAFANFNFQVMAENMRGQLRNYGFEEGSGTPVGWNVTANNGFGTSGSATITSARARAGSTGTKSCQMTVTKTASVFGDVTLDQTVSVQAGEMLMMRFASSRLYTSLAAQYALVINFLDSTGATIVTVGSGYIAAPLSTDDGATFLPTTYNYIAPGGTTKALVQVTLQSLTGIGTASLFLDDVFVNVIS